MWRYGSGDGLTHGTIWPHLLTTFVEATLSFAIGAVSGVVAGFVLARAPFLGLVRSLHQDRQCPAAVVLAPIFLLWFGLGIRSKVALGVTVVFFVVFFNTYRGVREVERVIIDNARMLGASERQLVRHVLIPSALTWIFSSLHVSIGLAIIAVVVANIWAPRRGSGNVIAQAEGVFDTTGVFAGMTILAAGVLLIGGAELARTPAASLAARPDRFQRLTASRVSSAVVGGVRRFHGRVQRPAYQLQLSHCPGAMSHSGALSVSLLKTGGSDMIRWALRKAIGKFERDWNYDASYMRDMIDASPRAAWLFSRVTALGRFRRDVPLEAWFAAGITAVRHEDCGPCTQLGVTMADVRVSARRFCGRCSPTTPTRCRRTSRWFGNSRAPRSRTMPRLMNIARRS